RQQFRRSRKKSGFANRDQRMICALQCNRKHSFEINPGAKKAIERRQKATPKSTIGDPQALACQERAEVEAVWRGLAPVQIVKDALGLLASRNMRTALIDPMKEFAEPNNGSCQRA